MIVANQGLNQGQAFVTKTVQNMEETRDEVIALFRRWDKAVDALLTPKSRGKWHRASQVGAQEIADAERVLRASDNQIHESYLLALGAAGEGSDTAAGGYKIVSSGGATHAGLQH
jgi:hypothetical protein